MVWREVLAASDYSVSVEGSGWHTFRGLTSNPWPGYPLADAVTSLAAGDLDATGRWLAGLDLDDLPLKHDLEMLAFIAEVVAAAGTTEQRRRTYDMLLAYAGGHIVVGGCASYFGAVDHYLGMLARSVGRVDSARDHFETAARLHERLGAPAWVERSRAEMNACRETVAARECVFRRDGDVWTISYRGAEAHLPDSKGLRDLALLLARRAPTTIAS